MSSATGYVLRLRPERLLALAQQLEVSNRYVQPVNDFNSKSPFLCFVLDDQGAVRYVAKAARGTSAGTGLRKLVLTAIEAVTTKPDLVELAASVPVRFRTQLSQRISEGGLLTFKQFDAIMHVIASGEGELRTLARTYPFLHNGRVEWLSQDVRRELAYQRDAVGLALLLAGIDRAPLLEWTLSDGQKPASFLDGLPQARLREDAMIVNDLWMLPGFKAFKPHVQGAVDFADGRGGLMTVILANRLPLEELTGADLIYYNQTFRSFVMVQYKAMAQEHGNTVFRLPNPQLDKEVRRMDRIIANLGHHAGAADVDDFRLHSNPFFLKLCPRIVFSPDKVDLMKGMYIPLEKWKLLVKSSHVRGPKGGIGISYDNVTRYFDNTQFVALVSNAWVGTHGTHSVPLETAIRETLRAGRAAVVAMRQAHT
jgi:hypothetical protein